MPKSKRNRLVSLTATRKKNFSDLKGRLVEELHQCADEYRHIFVFRVDNMRNAKLKELRTELRYSRFFFGKNKVMSIGLGRSPEDEYKQNLHRVSEHLFGQCGLLFTNSSKEEISKFFESYRERDFARTGDIATETVQLYSGSLSKFPHNIEPYLRELGMPTSLQKGVVTLLKDYQVCQKGQSLTSEQARILKLLDNKMAEFRVKIDAMWCNDGTFEAFTKRSKFTTGDSEEESNEMDQEDESEDDDSEQ